MIAGRFKSTYLQKILCTLEMQNTFSEREREERREREQFVRIYMLVLLLHNMLGDSWSERI